jgi:hypothetical protein
MEFFSLRHRVQTAFGSIKPTKICVPGVPTPKVKRLGREADHSHPVPRLRTHSAIPPLPNVFIAWHLIKQEIIFMAWCLIKHNFSRIRTAKMDRQTHTSGNRVPKTEQRSLSFNA